MLTLISKDFNNIKWQFPKKKSTFLKKNYLVSDQLRTYGMPPKFVSTINVNISNWEKIWIPN
jgi:hypothetical protein